MPGYRDTRSINAPPTRSFAEELGSAAMHSGSERSLGQLFLIGLGRWLLTILAVCIGVRMGLGWFAHDAGKELERAVEKVFGKTPPPNR